jgi:hypothetical protein
LDPPVAAAGARGAGPSFLKAGQQPFFFPSLPVDMSRLIPYNDTGK